MDDRFTVMGTNFDPEQLVSLAIQFPCEIVRGVVAVFLLEDAATKNSSEPVLRIVFVPAESVAGIADFGQIFGGTELVAHRLIERVDESDQLVPGSILVGVLPPFAVGV